MLKKNLRVTPAIAAAASFGILGTASPLAWGTSVDVQLYKPAANSTYTMTEDAMLEVTPRDTSWYGTRLFFSAYYNYLSSPLVEYNADHTARTDTLIDNIQSLDLTVGWFVDRRVSLNFSAPLDLVQMPNQGNQFSFGDSRAFMKWRLTDDNALIAVSIMPELTLPTGNTDLFLSSGSVGYGGLIAFEHDFGALRAAANIGYRYNSGAQYLDLNYTQQVPMALGLFAPLGPRWGLNVEASGALVLPASTYNNPNEVYAGARYEINRDCVAMGGVSLGTLNSQAGNEFRISGGIRFSPMPQPPKPVIVATAPPPPPPAPVVAPPPVFSTKRVIFTPKEIKITEEVKFLHASAVLTKSGKKLLDEVALVMKKNQQSFRKILIEGHTNELGSYPYNQKLSEQRAASVKEYIASRGIDAKKLMTIGYGKTRPKSLRGLSRDAKLEANRRVEFKVIN